MRKVLPILLAIAIAMPALADVTVSVAEGTADDQIAELSIAIDGGAVVRGAAVKVTISGAELAAIADVTDVMAGFNAYIDYYYSNSDFLGSLPDETALPGTGAHPLADPDAAGVLATLPATTFVISLGALDNSGNQGGITAGGLLAKVKLSNFAGSSAQVCIEADALRGGIVGDNLGTVTVSGCADIASIPQECVKSTAPFYADWVAFGKPDCWCYQRNCRGDINGTREGNAVTGYIWVYTQDLPTFLAAYGVKEPPKGPGVATITNGICADLNRSREGNAVTGYIRVYTQDLPIFLANYGVKEPPKGPGVPVCDSANYNFWTN